MFQGREVRAFIRAFDFLEAVRAHLHFATGRPEERMSFDLQPEIARRMGYADRPRSDGDQTPAVERFMRRYFLIAREVGALTRAFAAKLEAEHLKTAPRGLSRFLPAGRADAASRWTSPASTSTAAGSRSTARRPSSRPGQPDPPVPDRRPARPRPAPGRLHRRHPDAAPDHLQGAARSGDGQDLPRRAGPRPRSAAHAGADERGRRAGPLHPRVRAHRRPDAVQHVPLLHGRRAHAARRRRDRRHRRRPLRRGPPARRPPSCR